MIHQELARTLSEQLGRRYPSMGAAMRDTMMRRRKGFPGGREFVRGDLGDDNTIEVGAEDYDTNTSYSVGQEIYDDAVPGMAGMGVVRKGIYDYENQQSMENPEISEMDMGEEPDEGVDDFSLEEFYEDESF